MLIDAVKGISKADTMLLQMMEGRRVPFLVVLTKADKVGPEGITKELKEVGDAISQYKYAARFVHATAIK